MRVKYPLLIRVQNREKIGLRAQHEGEVGGMSSGQQLSHPPQYPDGLAVSFQVSGTEAEPQELARLGRRRVFALLP